MDLKDKFGELGIFSGSEVVEEVVLFHVAPPLEVDGACLEDVHLAP